MFFIQCDEWTLYHVITFESEENACFMVPMEVAKIRGFQNQLMFLYQVIERYMKKHIIQYQ